MIGLLVIFGAIYAFTRNSQPRNTTTPGSTLAADPKSSPVEPVKPATGEPEAGIPAGGDTNQAATANSNKNTSTPAEPSKNPNDIGGVNLNAKADALASTANFLKGHGWVAMDPADVTKVMRQETSAWIKDAGDPLVAPVRKALFGSWEGNWMGYNSAADLALPGSRQKEKLGFLMYPQAEIAGRAVDPYDPQAFVYRISARELKPNEG